MIMRLSIVFAAAAVLALTLLLLLPAAGAAASCPVPSARTNDDYCDDLVQGCDEPQTSACSFVKRTPTFQCNASVTGEPHLLPASRVGDTVCDCCDGSDEAPGVCPNACQALQEEYLDSAFQWFEDVMAGKERRDAAIVDAKGILAGWEAELKTAEAARAERQELLIKLKELKAKEEKTEGWENFLWLREEAKRKGEVLEKEEQTQQEQQQVEEEEKKSEEEEAAAPATTEESTGDEGEAKDDNIDETPFSLPDDVTAATTTAPLPSSFKPARTVSVSFTDDANQKFDNRLLSTTATDGTHTLTLRAYLNTHLSSSSSSSSPASQPPKAATSVWEPTDILELNLQALGALVLGPFQALFWAGRVCKDELIDAWNSYNNKKRPHKWNATPPAAAPAATTTAAAAFEKDGWMGMMKWVVDTIARGPSTALALLRPETITNAPERLEAAMLRFAVEKVEDEVGREEGRVEELKEWLADTGYSAMEGDERVFLTWKDKCFEKQDKDFEYKICPFKEVKQNYLLVGKWAGWIEREDGMGSKDGAGPVMYFTEGQQCWNGPKRTAVVQLWCGPTEEVVEVTEPSVCLYDFVMMTPLVCDEKVVKEAEARLRRMGVQLPGDEGWEGMEYEGEEGEGDRIEREEL